MFNGIKKYLLKKKLTYISFYNLFVICLLAVSVTGYVIYLKSSLHKTFYVMASIQKPDWWQSTSQIPSELLSAVKSGETSSSGNLQVEEIKYFISQEPNWTTDVNDKSVGRIQFKISASVQNGKTYYDGQELLVGNPISVTVANTKLELLITDINSQKIVSNYVPKRITVRVYDKYPEQIQDIKKGMEIKDNDGFVYAKILDISTEHSRLTTYDQYGISHAQTNPWKFDLVMDIETLAIEKNARIVGYDGRTLAIGKSFIFNSPYFDDVGGWIVGIK